MIFTILSERFLARESIFLVFGFLSSDIFCFTDHIEDPRVSEAKSRLEKVKDDFERYKLKAEAVLKSKVRCSVLYKYTMQFRQLQLLILKMMVYVLLLTSYTIS